MRTALAALLSASSATAAAAFAAEPPRALVVPALAFGRPAGRRANRRRSGSSQRAAAASFPDGAGRPVDVPPIVTTTVLAQVYPALVAHKEEYGNPNIPLGSPDGKRCKTLRRMHFQGKLTDEEAEHLTEMGFRFHSFEDVYYECDFDEMLGKLLDYRDEFGTFQIPKKYDPDPELGAWVTMLRRLRRTNDLPESQVEKLDGVEFEWISTRKCGSSFMSKYREVLSRIDEATEAGGDAGEFLREDGELAKWIDAQRLANEKGNLSEARVKYMDELPGIDWKNPSGWA